MALPPLAAPNPPAPEPKENPPVAGFGAAAGVLKLKPPEAGAPKPPAAGAAGAPKGLELVGVPNAGAEVAPKGEEPPKAGVL